MTKRTKKTSALVSVVPEYSAIARALDGFRSRYGDLVFDCSTKVGDKDARRARQDLKEYQTQLEKARVAKKAPLLDQIREIDGEAKRIDGVLESLKAPIDAQIKAEEARVEQERQARVQAELNRVRALEHRIEAIADLVRVPSYASVEEIAEALGRAESVKVDESFQEFALDAESARQQAVETLRNLLDRAKALRAEREQAAAERAELEKLRAEAAAFRVRQALEEAQAPRPVSVPHIAAEVDAPAPAPAASRASPFASEPVPATSAPIPVLDVLRDALGYITSVKPPNGLNGRRAQLMATLENAIQQEELKRCLRR